MDQFLVRYLLGINCGTFFLWGWDKWQASKKKWRIRESTLLGCVAVGGGIGAILAQHLWHHKTIKGPFLRKFYLLLGGRIALCLVFWWA